MSDDLSRRARAVASGSLLLMAVWLLGWSLTSWKPLFLGLLAGTAASFVNAMQMAWRIRCFFRRWNATGRKPVSAGGMAFRFAMAALVALVAVKWPQHVDLVGVLVGLVTAPVMILIHGLISLKRDASHNNGSGKG